MINFKFQGALTSKPYAFRGRSWELRSVLGVDFTDALCSSIRIDYRGTEILRILPNTTETVNEEWISDRVRFFSDGLQRQRLAFPYLKKGNLVSEISWKILYKLLKYSFGLLKAQQIWLNEGGSVKDLNLISRADLLMLKGFLGMELDLRVTQLISSFIHKLGFGLILASETIQKLSCDFRSGYLFNDLLEQLSNADLVLFIGSNPRVDSAVINIKLRRIFRSRKIIPYVLGTNTDFGYPVNFIGTNLNHFQKIVKGRHWLNVFLAKSKRPLFILGPAVLKENKFETGLNFLVQQLNIKGNWTPYSFLGLRSGLTGFNEIGVLSYKYGDFERYVKAPSIKFLFYADDFTENVSINESELIIYQGHHGDSGAKIADIVVPGLTPLEKMSFYLNLEGVFVNSVRSIIRYMRSVPSDLIFFRSFLQYCNLDSFVQQKFSAISLNENWFIKLPLIKIQKKSSVFSEFIFSSGSAKNVYLTPLINSKVLSSMEFFKPDECIALNIISHKIIFRKINLSLFVENFYLVSSIGRFSKIMGLASQFLRKNYKTF